MHPGVRGLKRRLQTVNYWLIAQLALTGIRVLRLMPASLALAVAERFARALGPLFGRHRTALGNLRAAYPEKSEAEIAVIASDMWGHMARLATEYVFLDRFLTHEPGRLPAALDIEGDDVLKRIAAERDRPHILFAAHVGNFELLPFVADQYGIDVTMMFRAPNNPYIAAYLARTRSTKLGSLLPSGSGAALGLARVLGRGGNIGVLVDQKFSPGLRTTFFGRPCDTNPLVPNMALRHDCAVIPVRTARLPGNRFRIVIEGPLELPRTADGRVDVQATAQLLNDVVERWVREDPAQWMWFHKRWVLSPNVRKARPAGRL
ncbi:MAG: lipid A biosynthesis lauroyl acyltransferase [Rhizobiaceae bacterium]